MPPVWFIIAAVVIVAIFVAYIIIDDRRFMRIVERMNELDMRAEEARKKQGNVQHNKTVSYPARSHKLKAGWSCLGKKDGPMWM